MTQPHTPDGALPLELVSAGPGEDAAPRRKRRWPALLAAGLAAVLVMSGCAPLFGLIGQFTTPSAPTPSEVDGTDFGAQIANWQACGATMQCAVVQAPLDWDDAEGERIHLALVKQPALSGTSQGTIFVNPGGPGASGVDYVAQSIDSAVGEPLQQHFDIVGWDPRGVGSSTPVVCLDDAAMDEYLFGLSAADTLGLEEGSAEWVEASIAENVEFGAACLEHTGPLLGHVDTASTVHDLEMLRQIVGDNQLHYLGYSYGTYIGARYADAYPEHVGRLVLDGAIDPTSTLADVVREQTRGFELALRAYVTDCLTRSECPLTGTVDEAMAQWRALLDAVDAQPLSGADERWVTVGTLLTAIITPLYAQQNWPYLDQLYLSIAAGNTDVALFLADFYYNREDGVYVDNLITAFSAIHCLDYPSAEPLDLEQMRADAAELEQIAPTIGAFQGYGDVGCAGWPVQAVSERAPATAPGAEPILVIGTTGDPATPLRWAESLADQLESGVLLVYEGEGHTAYGENACVNSIVERYFLEGAVPTSGTTCQ